MFGVDTIMTMAAALRLLKYDQFQVGLDETARDDVMYMCIRAQAGAGGTQMVGNS